MIIDALYYLSVDCTVPSDFPIPHREPRTLRIAISGARYREVYKKVYDSFSQTAYTWPDVFASIVFECGGKLAGLLCRQRC
jgi:hypothetical protein